jgi:iron complex outermembrane receptor protein
MPDGQGQFSQFDLGSAGHIEVLRGPFSALYGNSSGGVIAIFTEDAKPGRSIEGTAEYGTFNFQRYALKTEEDDGVINYVLDAAHFQTDGYRFHSNAERDNFNSKLRFATSDTSKLTFVVNVVETPSVQDPLGLTRAQLAADPRQAGVGAVQFNTRKSLDQEQLGAVYDGKLSANDDLSAMLYTGHRATTQFQAIPQATQQNAPLYPGGVIDLDRAYWGIDAHVTDAREIGGTSLQVVAGLNYDDLEEARKGYLNYVGSQLGVAGAVRRDEANHVYDFDQYLQAQWDPGARWRLIAGVRNNLVEVSSHGHIPVLDGADSSVRYSAVNPVGGITFRASSAVNLYGSYGKGFETPTLNDLAYRSVDGSLPGLSLGLIPRASRRALSACAPTWPRSISKPWTNWPSCRIPAAGRYLKTWARPIVADWNSELTPPGRVDSAAGWPTPTCAPSWVRPTPLALRLRAILWRIRAGRYPPITRRLRRVTTCPQCP